MRSALAVALIVAACGYDKPTDICNGPCFLLGIERSTANEGSMITLEGNFQDGMLVSFPGGIQVTPEGSGGEHRLRVVVPAEATEGDLTVSTSTFTSEPVDFRRPTFDLALQSFFSDYDQADVGRIPSLGADRKGHALVVVQGRIHQIGGQVGAGASDTIDSALVNRDGTLGAFLPAGTKLAVARMNHQVVVAGSNIYVLGGTAQGNALDSVETAPILADGTFGPFTVLPNAHLVEGRSRFAAALIGRYIYAIGGRRNTTDLFTIERARIRDTGELGPFETLPEFGLVTPRSGHTIAIVNEKLWVIGGERNGEWLSSIERSEIYPTDEGIGQFGAGGSLVVGRADHVSVVVGSKLYVMGGRSTAGLVAATESAELGTDQLAFENEEGLMLRTGWQSGAAAIVGNYVYLLGGVLTSDVPVRRMERASIIASDMIDPFAEAMATPLTKPRSGHVSLVAGNKLYVIGGQSGNDVLDTIEVAEIKPDGGLGEFKELPTHLTVRRYRPTAFVDFDRLYIVGGADMGGMPLASIEVAQIGPDGSLSGFTDFQPQLIEGRFAARAATALKTVLVTGGKTTTMPSQSGEGVSFVNGTLQGNWAADPMLLKQSRAGHSTIVLGGAIYVIGGADGNGNYRQIERQFYDDMALVDPFDVYAARLLRPREGHTSIAIGNTLYVIGGSDNGASVAPIERATLNHNNFPSLADSGISPPQRLDHTAVTIGNFVYLIGGRASADLSSVASSTIR